MRGERAFLALAWRPGLALGLLALMALGLSGQGRAYTVRADEVARTVVCQCGCTQVLYNCNHQGCGAKEVMYSIIEVQLARGESPQDIVASLVAYYGEPVLAAPTKEGFNLTAWTLPFVALLAGVGLVALVLRAWVGAAALAPASPAPPQGGDAAYRRRVEEELKRLGWGD